MVTRSTATLIYCALRSLPEPMIPLWGGMGLDHLDGQGGQRYLVGRCDSDWLIGNQGSDFTLWRFGLLMSSFSILRQSLQKSISSMAIVVTTSSQITSMMCHRYPSNRRGMYSANSQRYDIDRAVSSTDQRMTIRYTGMNEPCCSTGRMHWALRW